MLMLVMPRRLLLTGSGGLLKRSVPGPGRRTEDSVWFNGCPQVSVHPLPQSHIIAWPFLDGSNRYYSAAAENWQAVPDLTREPARVGQSLFVLYDLELSYTIATCQTSPVTAIGKMSLFAFLPFYMRSEKESITRPPLMQMLRSIYFMKASCI
jgi:hypothetical protein